jgi:periplasmic copper chaperone A
MSRLAFVALALTLAAELHASPVFVVAEPWVRPAARGATTVAYLQVTSSENVTLTGVRSADATRAGIVDRQGRAVPSLELPAQVLVALAADGPRLRLSGLSRTLATGDHVALTLVLRDREGAEHVLDVDAEVRVHSPSHDHHVPHAH